MQFYLLFCKNKLRQANAGGSDVETKIGYITVNPVGIESVPELNSLLVFPNPTHGELFIQLGINGEEVVELELTSMEGKVLKTKKIIGSGSIGTSFNIEDLATSVYLLRITTGSGSIVKSIVRQ